MRPFDEQVGPYLYHGTDSRTLKLIQAEGMHTGESVKMGWLREPKKRLWFAKNANNSSGFAGRRITGIKNVLQFEEMARRFQKPILEPDVRSEFYPWELSDKEEEVFHEIGAELDVDYADVRKIILRMKEDDIPDDCDREDSETRQYVILDNCEIPPEALEVCDMPGAEPTMTLDRDTDGDSQ